LKKSQGKRKSQPKQFNSSLSSGGPSISFNAPPIREYVDTSLNNRPSTLETPLLLKNTTNQQSTELGFPIQNNNPLFNLPPAEKIELDLNNPIFTVYVDVSGKSPQSAQNYLAQVKNTFDIYKNVTMWIIASNKTIIECVYDGQCRSRDMEISDLIKEINTRIDIMSNSHSFDDFKINIRDWRLSELINGTEKK
jgi:hypothetical protein